MFLVSAAFCRCWAGEVSPFFGVLHLDLWFALTQVAWVAGRLEVPWAQEDVWLWPGSTHTTGSSSALGRISCL